jgi:Flp pilus assembly protein TadB
VLAIHRSSVGVAATATIGGIASTVVLIEWVYGRHRERLENQVPESICEGAVAPVTS